VNNAVFITYFELARGHYMPTACPGWDWHKHMFLIGNVNVDFRKEVRLTTSNPRVLMRTKQIGGKSFVLEYALTSERNGDTIIHATGTTTQIMFDMNERKTIAVADWVRESLIDYDGLS
jgi:acyl-CoA thioester hydrolase